MNDAWNTVQNSLIFDMFEMLQLRIRMARNK